MEQISYERAFVLLVKFIKFYISHGYEEFGPTLNALCPATSEIEAEWQGLIQEAGRLGLQATRLILRPSRGLWIKKTNYVGTNKYRVDFYAKTTAEGKQLWGMARDNVIRNCGFNGNHKVYVWKHGDQAPYNSPCQDGFLTIEEVFTTIYLFFDKQYAKNESGDMAAILSSMSTLENNTTADGATWFEWMDVVKAQDS